MSTIILPYGVSLPTTNGYALVEDVTVGDKLFSGNNKPIEVADQELLGLGKIYGINIEDTKEPQVFVTEETLIPVLKGDKLMKIKIVDLIDEEDLSDYKLIGFRRWKKVSYKIRKVQEIGNNKIKRFKFEDKSRNAVFVQAISRRIGWWVDMSEEVRNNGYNCTSFII